MASTIAESLEQHRMMSGWRSPACPSSSGQNAPSSLSWDTEYDQRPPSHEYLSASPLPAADTLISCDGNELLHRAEELLEDGELLGPIMRNAKMALLTWSFPSLVRLLRAVAIANNMDSQSAELLLPLAQEATRYVMTADAGDLVEFLHWLSHVRVRDQVLLVTVSNRLACRRSQSESLLHFPVEMTVAVLNSLAKLDSLRPKRLIDLLSRLHEALPTFSSAGCTQLSPLCVLSLPESHIRAYFERCAELNMALPLLDQTPEICLQFRILEEATRFYHRGTPFAEKVIQWFTRIREEGAEMDTMSTEPSPPLANLPINEEIFSAMEDLGWRPEARVKNGLFTVFNVVEESARRTFCVEVLSDQNYYLSTSCGRALTAQTKFRHRLLWRHGWKPVCVEEKKWRMLSNQARVRDFIIALMKEAIDHRY
eukprot:GEMP01038246.1.p1 GENE.GEMP01038246.1~~GEMP01038246.1.p1  ORF type:complete len:426 (+),score=89.15 GEMP01038246.1:110-1387(+)